MSSGSRDLGGLGSGVSSLNSLTGPITLVAGANVTITPSGSNITIAASGGGGGGSPGGSDGNIQYNSAGSFAGTSALNWDGINLVTTNVALTNLLDPNLVQIIDLTNYKINDSNGAEAIDLNPRYLINSGGVATFDFQNSVAYDQQANRSADFNVRGLYAADGATVTLDWGSLDGLGNVVSNINGIALPTAGIMWLNGSADLNWRFGLNMPSLPFTPTYITGANVSFVLSGQTAQGFAMGSISGSVFEVDSGSNTLYANHMGVTNTITLYNGITTAGQGVAPIVAAVDLTAQAGSITATSLYASTTSAMYEVSLYLLTTTTAVAGTVLCTIGWVDNVTSRAVSTSTILLTGNNYLSQSIVVKAATGTNIIYTTTVSGVTGSPRYELAIVVKKLT